VARCRWLCPIRAQISVLARRLADPALGELVLADDAAAVRKSGQPLAELIRKGLAASSED
jgi:hypothetical protein